MDYEHELVVPKAGMPFKIDRFEGAKGNYIRNPHWHNSVEIFAIYEGNLDFILREKTITVGAGNFIIINTNELHSIRAQKSNLAVYLQIPIGEFKNYLTGDHFISFHKKGKGAVVQSTPEELAKYEQEMLRRIHRIYQLSGSTLEGHEFEMLQEYYRIMQLMVTVYRQQEPDINLYQSSKALQRLSPITEYIKKHYAEELSLNFLAEKFGYSIEHLSRMFQKYAQINYKTYLSGIRLEHAMEEMEAGEKTISEIAIAVGFSDSRAMAKAFSKRFGMLPSEYRKQEITSKK
jgi:AraC-like DNA-binding protein/mannose-6-phosphate isomerase-like protein (cupin superfamily)